MSATTLTAQDWSDIAGVLTDGADEAHAVPGGGLLSVVLIKMALSASKLAEQRQRAEHDVTLAKYTPPRPSQVQAREPLRWTTSASADAENHDQETDLDAIGSPGGASWASAAPDGRKGHEPWTWEIWDRWLIEDGNLLANGEAASEDAAKAAVAIWVGLALDQERTP